MVGPFAAPAIPEAPGPVPLSPSDAPNLARSRRSIEAAAHAARAERGPSGGDEAKAAMGDRLLILATAVVFCSAIGVIGWACTLM